ncbi:MAG: VOC family protein [Lachnospiraceae bacterium]|jgi:lactoylglutathione lyase|nr:MAG: VOC family protein [Lachnospiraceae bacterium]
MTPGAYCDGIQHIGIPTDHLENTIHFYEDLGFQVILRTCVPEKNQHVAFLQLGNLVIETYEDPVALCDGAINHIALNCLDIEKAYAATLNQKHLVLSNGIEALDFWERGVRFFIIQGPNKERIEFCQKL